MPTKSKAAVKQLEKRGSALCLGLLCELGKIIIFVAFFIYFNERYLSCFLRLAVCTKPVTTKE